MVIGLDVETTYHLPNLPWLPGSYLVSLSIVTDGGERRSWLVNHPEATQTHEEIRKEVQDYVDRADRLVGHNFVFDLHWLRHFGIQFEDIKVYCTLVGEYVLRSQPKIQDLSLNDLAERYGFDKKIDKVKMFWDEGYETDEIPSNILNEYCEYDTELALKIYHQQVELLEDAGQIPLIAIEMESLRSFEEMEYNGMLLDREALLNYHEEYSGKIQRLDIELESILGIQNISSKDQLSCGLYGGKYKVDGRVPGKRPGTTKKGKVEVEVVGVGFKPIAGSELKKEGMYGTSIDVLTQLKARNKTQRYVKELLLERSRLDQLNKTYFKGLSERVGADGYVHPHINQALTVTGRLSCSNPKLLGL